MGMGGDIIPGPSPCPHSDPLMCALISKTTYICTTKEDHAMKMNIVLTVSRRVGA